MRVSRLLEPNCPQHCIVIWGHFITCDSQFWSVFGRIFFLFYPHLLLWSAVSLNPNPVDGSCASSQTCLASITARTQSDKQLLTIQGTSPSFHRPPRNRDFCVHRSEAADVQIQSLHRWKHKSGFQVCVMLRRPLFNIWINYLKSELTALHKTLARVAYLHGQTAFYSGVQLDDPSFCVQIMYSLKWVRTMENSTGARVSAATVTLKPISFLFL